MKRWKLTFLILLSLLSLFSLGIRAEDEAGDEGLLNKLLAPGKLIEGHRELEDDCLKCHTPRKGVPDSKCLDCHKEIRPSVEKKTGLHGLTQKTCIQCHSDHKDRAYDSTLVDEATFDHSVTGYILEGKHRNIKCSECHIEKRFKAKKKLRPNDTHYLGLTTSCKSCHKKDDIHYFKDDFAKKDCSECHGLKTWKTEIKFDHKKDGKYELVGKHAKMKCAECHVPKKGGPSIYKWPSLKKSECLACHKDQHGAHLSPKFRGGTKCLECHVRTQTTWKIEKFDHEVTDYPLRGSHAQLDCAKCHIQSSPTIPLKAPAFKFTGLKQDCISCHEDFHLFGNTRTKRNGRLADCLACHNESKWKPAPEFNHNSDTGFEIAGKHLDVKCEKCHTITPATARLPKNRQLRTYHWESLQSKTCEVCHKSPHTNATSSEFRTKKCDDCHTDAGWKIMRKPGDGRKGFNHDNTRYPLTGKHRDIKCSACHIVDKKEVYKFPNAEKDFCISCHKNQHEDQFRPKFSERKCSECHNTKDFRDRLKFNHDETAFRIDGKHTDLKCEKCHTPTKAIFETKTHRFKNKYIFKSPDPKFCISCHQNIHDGQMHDKLLSNSCTDCHTTHDFKKRLPFDHGTTIFPLKGKHVDVKCQKCHIKSSFVLRTKPPRYGVKFIFPGFVPERCQTCHEDPHKGSFGKRCVDCHNEKDWRSTADFHKNLTLTGVHFSLECVECHKDGRRLSGMSENCILCHQKDDIHHGTLPNCGACHRQQFWDNAEFKHSLSNFPLRGIHRTLECSACHSRGVYQGTPSQCVDCHRAEALAFPGPPSHTTLIATPCSDCHNQFSFR